MFCPILKAGTMITSVGTRSQQYAFHGDCQFTASISHEQPECMKEKCEWFEKGCPAHPKPEEK